MPDRIVTINSRKYDGHIRRSWKGGLIHQDKESLILVGTFSEDINHNDLGHIQKGTVSFEHFWFDRWYNIFRFHEPDGTLKAHYANITMPPMFENGVIDYVDLDIDVVVWPDGRVVVLDRDDFEKNKVKYGYPDEVIQSAEDALAELLAIIERREFPFAESN
jgi:uncharacterized protein